MNTSIEGIKKQVSKGAREYYSFAVRIWEEEEYHVMFGWKYFPDTATIAAPSQSKGGERGFFHTAKPSPAAFEKIRAEAVRLMGTKGE